MKLIVAILAVLQFLNRTDWWVSGASPVKTKWMEQKVDNFNENNTATWKMRYMVNEKYFKPGGPIFIYVGGEVPITTPYLKWGLFKDIATEHGGIMFYTGHRFYGKSRVGESLSMSNLEFLNARQALADLAHFIRTQRANDSRLANSKVILVGCSYTGSLAVWFNRLYPELVDGTWAISAPILATAEFLEYFEIIGKAIRELGSPECYDRVERGMADLENMFYDNRNKDAKELLKLCDGFDVTNPKDIWSLFRTIQQQFATLVTTQNLYRKDVAKACDFLMKYPDDASAVAEYYLQNYYHGNDSCTNPNYLGYIYHYTNTSYENKVPRQWMYQMCNEFGWFQQTASNHQPFGKTSPITLDLDLCRDIFGADFTEYHIRKKIAKTNQVFGGLNPNVTNLYMTYGSLDPWTAMGPGETEISTVVPQYSHCAHIDSIDVGKDTPEMVASKQRVFAKVREWIGSNKNGNDIKRKTKKFH